MGDQKVVIFCLPGFVLSEEGGKCSTVGVIPEVHKVAMVLADAQVLSKTRKRLILQWDENGASTHETFIKPLPRTFVFLLERNPKAIREEHLPGGEKLLNAKVFCDEFLGIHDEMRRGKELG